MTEQFNGPYVEYLDLLHKKYFTFCKNQAVLEIGPLNGQHSRLILENNPSLLDVVEPNVSLATTDLKQVTGINNIIVDDALLFLSTPKSYDVVVCFGVLYHLHSPIHLLELIANHCRPKYILLDSVGRLDEDTIPNNQFFHNEEVNELGTRQVRPGFKFSGLKIICPGKIVQLSMERLGYNLILSNDLYVNDNFAKSGSWVGVWERKENQ